MLEFIKGQRLGRIAAELMGVSSSHSYMKRLSNLAVTAKFNAVYGNSPDNVIKLV